MQKDNEHQSGRAFEKAAGRKGSRFTKREQWRPKKKQDMNQAFADRSESKIRKNDSIGGSRDEYRAIEAKALRAQKKVYDVYFKNKTGWEEAEYVRMANQRAKFRYELRPDVIDSLAKQAKQRVYFKKVELRSRKIEEIQARYQDKALEPKLDRVFNPKARQKFETYLEKRERVRKKSWAKHYKSKDGKEKERFNAKMMTASAQNQVSMHVGRFADVKPIDAARVKQFRTEAAKEVTEKQVRRSDRIGSMPERSLTREQRQAITPARSDAPAPSVGRGRERSR